MRSLGSPQALEKRSLRAIRLVEDGERSRAVALRVHASSSSIVRWHQAYQKTGKQGWRPLPSPGRPRGLSDRQKEKLVRLSLAGPLETGDSTALWTLNRIGQVIQRHSGLRYGTATLWKLMRALGRSRQQPAPETRVRREQAIRYWQPHVWPHIKKTARLGAHGVFLDESGRLLVPSVRATWAPRGQTPHLVVAGSRTTISAISTLNVSSRGNRVVLYRRFQPQENIRAPQVVRFLRHLLRHLRGPLVLLWDRSRTHRARVVERLLQRHPRLDPHFFPGYAPELNPDEFVWAHLKRDVANSLPRDVAHLRRLRDTPVRWLRRSQPLLWACIRAAE